MIYEPNNLDQFIQEFLENLNIMVEKLLKMKQREIVKNEINNYRNLFVNELDYCQNLIFV